MSKRTPEIAARENARRRERYWEQRAAGVCYRCGSQPAVKGRISCLACGKINARGIAERRRKLKEQQHETRQEQMRRLNKERKDLRRAKGLCIECRGGTQPAESGSVRCRVHNELNAARTRRLNARKKSEAKSTTEEHESRQQASN